MVAGAKGDGLHLDDNDRALAMATVGIDMLHARTEMVASTAEATRGYGLHPNGNGPKSVVTASRADALHLDGSIVEAIELIPLELMDLPDTLLSEVVLYLPLKEAVVTLVLSLWYHYLW